MKYVVGIVGVLVFFIYGASQIAAGYAGIAQGLGPIWALGALGVVVVLRFTLPMTIGAFYGAMHVWGWHWAAALLFAAPGLLFLLPGLIRAIFSLATQGTAKLTRATPVCAEH
ncbi:MAG: hypothetical protein M3O06_02835 [Pseudomonadota bacterium]|nr:hypothetical protein [Pseudomonadota bacterium]